LIIGRIYEFQVIDKVPPFPDVDIKEPVVRWIPQDVQIQSYGLIKADLKNDYRLPHAPRLQAV
jgi:hypothetical protein